MDSKGRQPLAHTASQSGKIDTVRDHLWAVAERASDFAEVFEAAEEARAAGLLHDLGKYGELFQKRLRGEISGIDHWSPGAWIALKKYRQLGIAIALAVEGHHLGLQRLDLRRLYDLDPARAEEKVRFGELQPSETDINKLLRCLENDEITLPSTLQRSVFPGIVECKPQSAACMVDIRMLFSTLVDADFIETEAHFQSLSRTESTSRLQGPTLDFDAALESLMLHVEVLRAEGASHPDMQRLRDDLLKTCRSAADSETGTFTLTSPTGSGKTLSMLSFALRHAARNQMRRIIAVLPYLSIIEQTALVYRDALRDVIPEESEKEFILEHHSLSDSQGDLKSNERVRLLSENWDAPIIITTSVQFFESLFSNRPSSCRKLHRVANSVVLFDEVQTLPENVVVPTLAALGRLVEKYGCSVMFSTATQPAFDDLDSVIREHSHVGWTPREIVTHDLAMFDRIRRVDVTWPGPGEAISWDNLSEEVAKCRQALCIVNLKRHAVSMLDSLNTLSDNHVYHLSTSMCPAHRLETLREIRHRLEGNDRCLVISTQCVEAGVDLDFPTVLRAMAPLDSIAQAAGRCNRHGSIEKGSFRVFEPESDGARMYPSPSYGRATDVTIMLLRENENYLDIQDPRVFREFYRRLFRISEPGMQNRELLEAIENADFERVAKHYRIIDKASTINVLVPYGSDYDELVEMAETHGLTRQFVRRARLFSVNLYRPKQESPVWNQLRPVSVRGTQVECESHNWFIYIEPGDYDAQKGLIPSTSDVIIA